MAAEENWTIENEFASVRLRKLRTRNGERLRIEAPATGASVELDAIVLEALTLLEAAEFSKPLEHPYGAEPETDFRSLSDLLRRPPAD